MDSKIKKLIIVIVVLNLFDCFSTLYGYLNNYIAEVNPINNLLLEKNIFLFILFKLVTTLFLVLVFRIENKKIYLLKLRGAILLSGALGMVFVMHLRWMILTYISLNIG